MQIKVCRSFNPQLSRKSLSTEISHLSLSLPKAQQHSHSREYCIFDKRNCDLPSFTSLLSSIGDMQTCRRCLSAKHNNECVHWRRWYSALLARHSLFCLIFYHHIAFSLKQSIAESQVKQNQQNTAASNIFNIIVNNQHIQHENDSKMRMNVFNEAWRVAGREQKRTDEEVFERLCASSMWWLLWWDWDGILKTARDGFVRSRVKKV